MPDRPAKTEEVEITPEMVGEEILLKFAHRLELGLDCNVQLMACEEAVASLLGELKRDSWTICPPAHRFRS